MFCDICTFSYNKTDRVPLTMKCCGRSTCATCCDKIDNTSLSQGHQDKKCPFCKTKIAGKLSSQNKNFSLIEILPSRYTSKCVTHDSLSVLICEDCNEDLCAKCLLSHFKLDHNIIEFDDFTEKILMLENELKPYIKEGSKKIKLYSYLIESRRKNSIDRVQKFFREFVRNLTVWRDDAVKQLEEFHDDLMKKWVKECDKFDENHMITKLNAFNFISNMKEDLRRDIAIKKFYEDFDFKEFKKSIKYDDYDFFLEELNKIKLKIASIQNPFNLVENNISEESDSNFDEIFSDNYKECFCMMKEGNQAVFKHYNGFVIDAYSTTLNLAILDPVNREKLKKIHHFYLTNSIDSILPICKEVKSLCLILKQNQNEEFLQKLEYFTNINNLDLDLELYDHKYLLKEISERFKDMRSLISLGLNLSETGSQENFDTFLHNLKLYAPKLSTICFSGIRIKEDLFTDFKEFFQSLNAKNITQIELTNILWTKSSNLTEFMGDTITRFFNLLVLNLGFMNAITPELVQHLNAFVEKSTALSSFNLAYNLDENLDSPMINFEQLLETLSKKKTLKILKMRREDQIESSIGNINVKYFKRGVFQNFMKNQMMIFEIDCLYQIEVEPVFPKKINSFWMKNLCEFEFTGKSNVNVKKFHILINLLINIPFKQNPNFLLTQTVTRKSDQNIMS